MVSSEIPRNYLEQTHFLFIGCVFTLLTENRTINPWHGAVHCIESVSFSGDYASDNIK
ncbi:hypothetical protein DN38_3222 [Vibrio cholerae]|nr:hypothetical protein DN38_3222 [Vibrio cholerae]